jgi:HK97 gp10 family phage protein
MGYGVEVVTVMDALPAVAARLPGAVDAVLSAGMERMAQYARANHPWQNRTGETEASIHMEKTGDHEFAVVAGGASIFLEWGTVNMPPFPFLQPAFDATEPSIEDGLGRLEEHLL